MDIPLTPKKIQRLIHLAEDKSFNERRILLTEDDVNIIAAQMVANKSFANYESSSGILDLERMEGFGESSSGIGNLSLSKSTAFNPGEMTGRSTGADEVKTAAALEPPRSDAYRRYSLALESFTSELEKQSAEVNEILRHSIASNYSFHSKRDLTADEVSLIAREAPLPVPQSTYVNITETPVNQSNLSVGAYFQNRCLDFGKILGHTDSPDKSNMMPSITEVSPNPFDGGRESNPVLTIDDTLDCVPVRQPRSTNAQIPAEHHNKLFKKPDPVTKIDITTPKVAEKKFEPTTSKIPVNVKSGHINAALAGHKSFMTSSKPADLVLKNLHSSVRLFAEDTESSVENSISISKIADYLGKQSNVSVTDMLKFNQKKTTNKKQPLTELHMNTQEKVEVQVTHLKDTRKTETASSAGTINTVIENVAELKIDDIPEVIITQPTLNQDDLKLIETDDVKVKRITRSKSPSSKSQSTLSTVRDNFNSFKTADSPVYSNQGEASTSKIPSPNVEYKELDKSVDWQEVLQFKCMKQERLVKEQWAEIEASAVDSFVGVSTVVTITVTTLTDSWLTAKLQFDNLPNDGKDLNFEMPRLPLLLSPRKSEQFTVHVTSKVEMDVILPFTIFLRDTSIDGDLAQKANLHIKFKLPTIQAMSSDGMNKVCFPPVQEKACLAKGLVLISDCPVDLLLELSMNEGDSIFSIRNVQEVKKSDVNKILLERYSTAEDQTGKAKGKPLIKQLCRLTSGNAIKVIITFNAPKLADLQPLEPNLTLNGALNVNLIGVNTVLRKVDLIGVVGSANLITSVPSDKLYLCNEPTGVNVTNTGSIVGSWAVKFKSTVIPFPFKVAPSKFEVPPGATRTIQLSYNGAEDSVIEATIIFEDIATGNRVSMDVTGGTERPKSFPIKTNHNTMSWVRAGRKELSLKSDIDKKIHIRCQIVGEGFSIDLPGVESRGIILPFSSFERRPLPIVFTPNSNMPLSATLHLVYDKNSDYSRKIKLYGCASGSLARWSGLVTYGDTALVRAASRAPIDLRLYNKSVSAAFVCARVHFNLQYMSVEPSARLSGARRVVGGRAHHSVTLRVDWARVERRARDCASAALATVTVLTGSEFTRRRILRILREESDGELNTSLLPDHLKVLADQFEGEDATADNFLTEFHETKASLTELIGGLQELTAQIDLPQDFADENNTIIISDDTVIDHHTLCD